jgi:hypothetical protein
MKYSVIGAVLGLVLSTAVVLAGGLDPDPALGGPSEGGNQMYTLEQIYDRLNTGATGSKMTSFTEPSTGPGPTGHTLDEVMAIAPALDASAAGPSNVLEGTTYWSLNGGAWGPQTGTAAEGGDVDGEEGLRAFGIPDGFYSGRTATANDSDLVADNIKAGVNIFGVDGSLGVFPAPVPKTGQTWSWATGDDGDLEMGVAWPDPRFTWPGDGTMIDHLTGLIWLEDLNCFGTSDWATALTDCNGLADGSCGLTDGSSAGDWRLPNIRELHSLVDYDSTATGLHSTALPERWTKGDPLSPTQVGYWSSTPYGHPITGAWVVWFDGRVDGCSDLEYPNVVWPVRGGQ